MGAHTDLLQYSLNTIYSSFPGPVTSPHPQVKSAAEEWGVAPKHLSLSLSYL